MPPRHNTSPPSLPHSGPPGSLDSHAEVQLSGISFRPHFLPGVSNIGTLSQNRGAYSIALLQRGGYAHRMWQSLLGLLAATEKLVPLGHLHTREAQNYVSQHWEFKPLTSNVWILLSPTAEDLKWWMSGHNSHCPMLARSDLVSTSPRDAGGVPVTDTQHPSVAVPTTRTDPSRSLQSSSATHMESIQDALCSRGFSIDVASCASRPHRESTLAIYESKCRIFSAWCIAQQINPLSATESVDSDFSSILTRRNNWPFQPLKAIRWQSPAPFVPSPRSR